ncbi:MAG: Ca-activated chloride channel [Blastocatellia bacterium]|jgi:VWFA-related protein|nr:Ca-activated chloride channel [Blastocatellia bacterium]
MSMQLPKPKRLTWLLIPAVLVSLIIGLPSKSLAQEKEPVDVLKVETDLVVFDAQVIDKKTRRVIGDLSKDDFELYEKGVKQSISYFGRDELPLSIMLLLDVSGSVRPILHQIRDGALNALQRLKPQDQVAVMAFANISNLAQDFTKDRSLAARKIREATATDALGRGTLLGPALESATFHMQTAATQASRRVIIVVTDNIAFASGAEQREILEGLFDSGTVVYGLIVRAAFGKVFNVLFLGQIKGVNKFVEETGGEVLGANKDEVDQKLGVVIDRLRARYALGFRPASATSKDEFRPVVIKISSARKRKEKPLVLTKRGYYLRRR